MKIHERRWIDDGPVARRARTCAAARDSRGSTRSRTPGSARPPRPSSRRASTLATTDAAATESTVWSALTIVRTVRGIAEVVVLAVEHDAVGLEALRRELRERAARRAAQRLGHAELVALVVARVPDADAARPAAHTRARRPRVRRASAASSRARRDRCSSPGTTAATVTGPGPRAPADLVDPDDDPVAGVPALPLDAQRRVRVRHARGR